MRRNGVVWEDYMEMNYEDYLDHNVEGDAVEYPVDCVSRGEVVQASKENAMDLQMYVMTELA